MKAVIKDFQLLYSDDYLGNGLELIWRVEEILQGVLTRLLGICKPGPSFFETAKLVHRYMNCTSEAICKAAIDLARRAGGITISGLSFSV